MSLSEKLNDSERMEWQRQLAIVARGKQMFWQTLIALGEIRKQRLFREDFETFEKFVNVKMDLTLRYASMLISAAQNREELGTIIPENVAAKLDNPWKLRNLSGLTTAKMVEVVTHAESCSGGGEITSTMIAQSRRLLTGQAQSDEQQETSDAMARFEEALCQIDSVDALAIVLATFGGVPEQCIVLEEACPELVAAIRA